MKECLYRAPKHEGRRIFNVMVSALNFYSLDSSIQTRVRLSIVWLDAIHWTLQLAGNAEIAHGAGINLSGSVALHT